MSVESLAVPKVAGRRGAALSLNEKPRKFLPEVQGLRALAVLMVVAYHVWFGRISGGVDIFLLISSFLLTGQFTRKLESGQALELLKYWAHLFKRLLPLIAITLLMVLGATRWILPSIAWTGVFNQTWASLFYYQNWLLAAESVDYYAMDHSLASPLQHFWSLSIQGQIFILWPLVFALAALAAKRWDLKIRPLLLFGFGTIFAVSLFFSIVTTQNNQEFAYFDTRTRLWEFALGSILALTLPYLRFSRTTRIVIGWVGIVAMLSCGLILQVGQQFPGYMALWPTLAGAFVIIAGFTGSRIGVDRFLSWKPLVRLGDSSYALYLFHWPILVIFLIISDRQEAGPLYGLGIIIVSIVAAVLATKYIDTPLRRNKWIEKKRRRAMTVIAVCSILVVAPLAGLQLQVASQERALLASADKNNPGAAALREGFVDEAEPGAAFIPPLSSLTRAGKEWVKLGHPCAGSFVSSDPRVDKTCEQNIVTGKATKTIMILGDSHARQWMGALIPIAEKYNWQLVAVIKGGCTFGEAEPDAKLSADCADYNVAATAYALDQQPDAVFTVSTISSANSPNETVRKTFTDAVTTFTEAGIDVVGIRDNARFQLDMGSCVAKNGVDACSFSEDNAFAHEDPAAYLDKIEGVHLLDLTDRFCYQGRCPAVIGNVLVYMDKNHVTAKYSRSMSADMDQRLFAATKWPKNT